jgi:hypothetical protein
MTALTESQLMIDIGAQLDTLYGSFDQQNDDISTLVAAVSTLVTTLDTVIDTLATEIGTAVQTDQATDLANVKTEADTMLTASA